MELSALAGNRRIKQQLSRRERGLSHAYIISGPGGSGRHTLARLLAAEMMCTAGGERPCGRCAPCVKVMKGVHPDVLAVAGTEGKPIAVDQVRALRSDAYVRPNEGARKVYVLEEADRMNPSAQNAMLKLLEEGPAYAAFLLIAGSAGGLLQTVRSRCGELAMAPVPPGECEAWLQERFPGQAPEQVRLAALDCQGILGRAVERLEQKEAGAERRLQADRLADALERAEELELMEAAMAAFEGKSGREELSAFLELVDSALGERLVRAGGGRRLVRAMELVRTLRDAARLNVNGGQLSGWLCAGMFSGNEERLW